jgi:ABC-type glycerol-3-phosphate transport system substrate-binding protein
MKLSRLLLALLPAVIFALGVFAWNEYNRTAASVAEIKTSVQTDAITMLQEFEKDEMAANQKFNGKAIAVTGTVVTIENTDSVQQVVLGNRANISNIVCQFDAKQKEQLAAVTTGSTITIKGICTGMLIDVIFTNCIIENTN